MFQRVIPSRAIFRALLKMNCSIASPKVSGNVCNAGGVGKDPISDFSGIACCAYRKSPMRYDNKGAAGAPISFAVGRNADDAALHTGEKSWFWTSIRAKRLRF